VIEPAFPRRVLEESIVLSQNDLERERYLARGKVQRDELSRLHSAREEGLERGLERGQLIGAIHLAQRLLRQPLTPMQELQQKSLDDLRELSQRLEQELAR